MENILVNCKNCGKVLPKNRRKFCCNRCKDKFHNSVNPRGIFAHIKKDIDWQFDEMDGYFSNGDN
jgi:Zn finger protein HypA/HybF involved in hydrogenase expression